MSRRDSSASPASPAWASDSGNSARGFTLVEMLLSLALLAMLATMGIAIFHRSIEGRVHGEARLDEIDRLERLHALMIQDFEQAIARAPRDIDGTRLAAFVGRSDSLALVRVRRGGYAALSSATIERVRYSFAAQSWRRAAIAPIDGVALGQGDIVRGGLQAVRLAYRDSAGAWRDEWDSQARGGYLPHAVRVEFISLSGARLRMLFLTPPQLPLGSAVQGGGL